MTKRNTTIPGQRSLLIHAVPDAPAAIVERPGNAGTVVAGWVDYCTTRQVRLPRRIIGQYARLVKEALDDGFDRDTVARVLAQMLDDGVADRPHLLPNRLVRWQTGPEVRRVTTLRTRQVQTAAGPMSSRDLDNLRVIQWAAEQDAAEARALGAGA
jgi:hypothetical protein